MTLIGIAFSHIDLPQKLLHDYVVLNISSLPIPRNSNSIKQHAAHIEEEIGKAQIGALLHI